MFDDIFSVILEISCNVDFIFIVIDSKTRRLMYNMYEISTSVTKCEFSSEFEKNLKVYRYN